MATVLGMCPIVARIVVEGMTQRKAARLSVMKSEDTNSKIHISLACRNNEVGAKKMKHTGSM
jgi:hypothetical protein